MRGNDMICDIQSYSRIYIYGYSNQGRNAYNKLKKIFPEKTIGYIVTKRNKRISNACSEGNKSIYELAEIKSFDNTLIVIALNSIFHDTVRATLRKAGFTNHKIYNDEMDSQINLLLDGYPKLELRFLAMSIGQACNLKCRDCMNFSPYALHENMRYPIKQVKEDFDRALDFFCEIDTFHIQGGEPFLYTDLGELLYYCKSKFGNVLKNIQIATNGTIIPDKNILKSMVETNTIVRISNYPIRTNSRELIEVLNKYKITYKQYNFINRIGEWSLGGGIDYVVPEDEDVENKFYKCKWNTCYTIENSMIGRCARSIPAQTLQKINIRENDYIDLRQENDLARMGKYFMFLNPMACCWHCKGSQGEPIQPAIQIGNGEE